MPSFDRRQFFRLSLRDVSREAGKALRQDRQSGKETSGESDEMEPFLRPPGALEDEEKFLDTCEGFKACAKACPHDVIHHFGPAAGRLENTPVMDPAVIPCRWCEEMPCIEACPSGALARGEGGTVAPVAKVVLNLDNCLNIAGILCDTCAWRCPTHIRAIRMAGRKPVLDEKACVGCGMCAFHCEAEPNALEFAVWD